MDGSCAHRMSTYNFTQTVGLATRCWFAAGIRAPATAGKIPVRPSGVSEPTLTANSTLRQHDMPYTVYAHVRGAIYLVHAQSRYHAEKTYSICIVASPHMPHMRYMTVFLKHHTACPPLLSQVAQGKGWGLVSECNA